jgi:DNA repair protein SbcC/Rad50
MIPQRLLLRNFMCYRAGSPAIDFSGIRLACISGDNGNGKSALLDAITWALWGRARAKSDDELITMNASEMEVDFQFRLGEDVYAVNRKRRKLKAGQTTLELHVLDGDSWRGISGDTVRDTESRIAGILRMEYETFINSSFLLQGRADEFTVKPPSQRKQILADILGLSIYDDLEVRAKEQARLQADRAKNLADALREIDLELAHLPDYEVAHQAALEAAGTLAESLRAQEDCLRSLREEKSLLDGKSRQSADARLRLARAQAELTEARRNLGDRSRRLSEHEALIAEAGEIERGHADLQSARQDAETQGRKLALLVHLQQQKAALEQAIAAQSHTLDGARQVAAAQVSERTAKAAQTESLAVRLAGMQTRVAEMAGLARERDVWRESVLALSNRTAALRSTNEQLKRDMEALKLKIAELAGVTNCPLCDTALTPEHREEVRRQYSDEGTLKGDAFRANKAEMAGLATEMAARQARIAQADATLLDQPALQRQEAAAEQLLGQARQCADELVGLQAKLSVLEARLAGKDYASDERLKLAGIERQVESTAYDRAAHEAVQQRVAALTPFELRKSRLESARQDVEAERDAVARCQRQIERYQESVAEDQQVLQSLAADLANLEPLTRQLTAAQASVDDLQGRERMARLQLGAAQQRLSACRQLVEVRKDKAGQETQARQERSLHEELAVAFGKRGVQAMLIEEALPELEEEANRLLGRITGDRMRVVFDTQRESKKGETIETLDIRISDELGARNYETYSGGESFRINFAIRVALSKLVAGRAGASLQTLVIDEGFGTQDAQGRERLIEAINSIQDDFEMILAITHIQEMKDAFPVQIEVTKGVEGSTAVVG